MVLLSASGMDPTEAERNAMVNMAKVFGWAGFVEADIINASTVTGSLASLLWCDTTCCTTCHWDHS